MSEPIGVARIRIALSSLIALSPLIVAFVCSIIFRLTFALWELGIRPGILLGVFAAIPLANYFFEILEHRALGKPDWPVLSVETVASFKRQLSLVFVFIIGVAALVQAGFMLLDMPLIGEIFGVLVLLAVPVSAALLAVTRSIARAVSPTVLVSSVIRMGFSYGAILLASICFWLLARYALLQGRFFILVIASYCLLALGFFIGSVVFLNRRKLGIVSSHAPEEQAAAAREAIIRKRETALADAYAFASRGNRAGAAKVIKEYAQTEDDALAAEGWLLQQVMLWQDQLFAYQFAQRLHARLLESDRQEEAAKLALVCDMLLQQLESASADS